MRETLACNTNGAAGLPPGRPASGMLADRPLGCEMRGCWGGGLVPAGASVCAGRAT